MLRYIVRRIGYLFLTLVGVSIIIFASLRILPGSPVTTFLGIHAKGELLEYYSKQLGLDKPLHFQYFIWLKNVMQGSWGVSVLNGLPVYYLVMNRFYNTAKLALFSIILTVCGGILFGVASAYEPRSIVDKIIRLISSIGFSTPSFLTGLILIYIFALQLRILPVMGFGSIQHLILPGITLSLWGISFTNRMTRGSIMDIMEENFVKILEAKGLGKMKIFFNHILRNSLLPIVTILGIQVGWLLGGSYIVETIFNYPGIGQLTILNISSRDYPIVQGSILFTTFIFGLINLVVDILYVYLDPRIRYETKVM